MRHFSDNLPQPPKDDTNHTVEIEYKVLQSTNFATLHASFIEAFSDYQMKLNLSLAEFQLMMTRRGFDPTISMGAFTQENSEPVGFILNGLRLWNDKLTAYDTGTGVIPTFRKQGITSTLFAKVLKVLAQQSVEQYLLEVLKDNTVAYNLYKSQGFVVTRTFSIYQLNKLTHPMDFAVSDVELVSCFGSEEWELLKDFWDVPPSWQNSIDSINATSKEFIYALVRLKGKPIGYGIVGKRTGDVPQLAVHPEYRRQGVATRILASLMQHTHSSHLRFVNIDDSSQTIREFLTHVGCDNIGGQYEMLLPLTKVV
jgi:ribosomal protein S18 acetylase RimI-like enzyme